MRILIILFFSFMMSGCYLTTTQQANVTLNSVNYLNPDQQGIAKPVVITIFTLKRGLRFKSASYQQLNHHPESTLHDELLDLKKIEIPPATTQKVDISLPSEAHYIGIIAGYHTLQETAWKKLLVIPSTRQYIKINLHADTQGIAVKLIKSIY